VARRTALLQQPETLAIVREMLERVEAHLKAEAWFTVVTNMRGESQEDVAMKLIALDPVLAGLQVRTHAWGS
jgi:ATP phosphoribosyltransferase